MSRIGLITRNEEKAAKSSHETLWIVTERIVFRRILILVMKKKIHDNSKRMLVLYINHLIIMCLQLWLPFHNTTVRYKINMLWYNVKWIAFRAR